MIKTCPFCAEEIPVEAVKCDHCDSDLRLNDDADSSNEVQPQSAEPKFHNKIAYNTESSNVEVKAKNKTTAGLLAIFLGGLGLHKFYLGFTGPGLVYLLVNTIGWAITWMLLFIPNIVLFIMAFIEGIIYLTQADEGFEQKYIIEQRKWF